jgi:hypothetical protein
MEQQEEDAPNGLAGWPDFRKFQLEGWPTNRPPYQAQGQWEERMRLANGP